MKEIPRQRELAYIEQGFKQGRWFLLYAPSASGKTTFLSQTERRFKAVYRVQYVSLRACFGLDTAGVYATIAAAVRPGARAGSYCGLRDLIISESRRLLLLIDDLGILAPGVLEELVNGFSALHSESRLNPSLKLWVILASSKDLFSGPFSSCLNTLEELFLPDLTEAETQQLLGRNYHTVWEWAAGHPWLTQRLASWTAVSVRDAIKGNTLLNLTRSRLSADLLEGYREGIWTEPRLARRLILSGLAKENGGLLVVRNRLFRGVIEDWLAEHWKVKERDCSLPGKKHQKADYGGKLVVDREAKEIYLNGAHVSLTAVEYRILEHLLLNSRLVISRDNLAQAAFPFEPVPSADVESHIKNIRRKLGDRAANSCFIRSRRGFGYQAVENSFIFLAAKSPAP